MPDMKMAGSVVPIFPDFHTAIFWQTRLYCKLTAVGVGETSLKQDDY